MKALAPQHILSIKTYEPGKPIEELERELGVKSVVKMASNENCLGASPLALKAISKKFKDLHFYPDSEGFYLKNALSEKLDLNPNNLILGDGSNEVIEIISHAFVCPGEEIITCQSSFVVYEIISEIVNAQKVLVPLSNYTFDLSGILNKITPQTKLIFIANPNNPTGTAVTQKEVEYFMEKVPGHVIVVFDEAYFEYADSKTFPETIRYVREGRNVIVLRTFSKAYGLAGLRVGYGMAKKELVDIMNRVRRPFNVNSLGLVGALAAVEDEEHLRISRENNRLGKEYLYCKFDEMGVTYVPTEANFILVKVGKGRDVYQKLLRKGVIIRPMDVYGLGEFIRVTIGLPKENKKFIQALKEVL